MGLTVKAFARGVCVADAFKVRGFKARDERLSAPLTNAKVKVNVSE